MSFISKSSEKSTSLRDAIMKKKSINATLGEENTRMQSKRLAAGSSRRYNCLGGGWRLNYRMQAATVTLGASSLENPGIAF